MTAAIRPVMTVMRHGKRRRRFSGSRRPNGSSSVPQRLTCSGPWPRAPVPAGCSSRTAAPVALRRATRGVTAVILSAGRRSASLTSATMIGVNAVAITEPRCQNVGTTIAAVAAARLEMIRVCSERPLCFFSSAAPEDSLHRR